MSSRRPTLLLAVLVLLAGAFTACKSSNDRGTPTTPESLREAGVVRVGFANEAPYAYRDEDSGDLTGEAPVIARKVFERMGVPKVEGVLTEFGSLIPGLKAGRFDIIAAGMYVTPERCEQIAFSEPSYCIGEAFLVRKGNPLDLHSYEDAAKHDNARLGVVAGTVELGYAEKTGVPSDRIVVFPDPPSALAGVQADRVDAFAGTSLTVQDLIDKTADDSVERAEPFTDPVINGEKAQGCGAFGFRTADEELRKAFDTHLAELLGSDEHEALVRPFGFTAADIASRPTTASLCQP
ncbi:ectoine/hydroxyectoine ABC transporter substrate-binding protein EhuB [Haliangium sp.]|uniref:ectoine/hydroxyectoine ABC transporter substrate-binding protein EhuB n=1 Tax=Haliangium sp. TaxID=2663208 RepID=UPI003D11CFDD